MATLPPDTRSTGTPDPAGDNNNLVDCVSVISGAAPGGTVTAQQTMDTLAAAVTSGSYLRGNGTHVVMNTIQAADLPTGTTGAKGALQLDGTAADITADGTQGAGAIGQAADSGHIHPFVNGMWLPSSGSSGYLGWNSDPAYGSGGGLAIAGTVYLQRLNFFAASTVTNLVYWVPATLGAGASSTGTFVGLYSSGGTLLSGSSDLLAKFNASGTTGAIVCPLTTPQNVSAGTFGWAACVFNLATTQPTLLRQQNTAGSVNGGLTAANFRWAVNGTGQTSLPASITPSSNAATAFTYVVAWS